VKINVPKQKVSKKDNLKKGDATQKKGNPELLLPGTRKYGDQILMIIINLL